jgi:hypothetical protein
LDQIMQWSLWLGVGAASVRKPAAGDDQPALAVVGQRLDLSLVPDICEEVTLDSDEVPDGTTESEGKAHGLPVFCGSIRNIQKPQVFRFTKDLNEAVVVRVQPSSYILLEMKRQAEGRLQFKLQEVQLQPPVVLMPADAPVPYIDPIPSPPQPFPYKSLLATYTSMLSQASASFTARRQSEWMGELDRVSTMLAEQATCEQCEELQQSISSIKVASGRKKRKMTKEQLQANKEDARRRNRLQTQLSRHLSTVHQSVRGIWSRQL